MNVLKFEAAVVLYSLILQLLAVCAYADVGTSGWQIFTMVHSAQFSGISSAAPAEGDITGSLYNPAMLGTLKDSELSFNSEQGLDSDALGSIIYGEPLHSSMITGGFAYYDAGTAELNWIDNNGALNTQNVAAERDTMGFISFQHMASKVLSWGISLKGASSILAERQEAHACAVDAGVLILLKPNLSLSFAAQNIGSSTKFIAVANQLPTAGYAGCGYIFRFGSAYMLSTIGVTYFINDVTTVPEAGLEFGLGALSFNAGYSGYQGEANTQIGFQLKLKSFVFGYAFLPSTNLNSVQRLSISYRFKTRNP